MLRQRDESRSMLVHRLVLGDQFVKVDCLLSDVSRALLVWFEAKSVAAFDHIGRAETEAKNRKF